MKKKIKTQIGSRYLKVFESRGLNGFEKHVEEIKSRAAALLESIDNIPGTYEADRLVSLAKTDLESSVMWAVKAISRT